MIKDQLELHIKEGKDLLGEQRAEVLHLCSRAYDVDFEPFLQSFLDPTHVLAYIGGTLVSHALWITRWLEYDHSLMLHTAYVEAVATLPDYQNRGLGSKVMRTVQANIQDFVLGALSPSDYHWYARLGWERWRGSLYIRTDHGEFPTPGDEVMILRSPQTPMLDLQAPLSAEWREGELW
jgi:aminoglycoside 2'-N-acetyltransferase I